MSLLGKDGLVDVATHCHAKAEYLKSKLDFAEILNDSPTFNEFTVRLQKDAKEVVQLLSAEGFQAGIPLSDLNCGGSNDLLIAVTEKRTRADLDAFAQALETASCS